VALAQRPADNAIADRAALADTGHAPVVCRARVFIVAHNAISGQRPVTAYTAEARGHSAGVAVNVVARRSVGFARVVGTEAMRTCDREAARAWRQLARHANAEIHALARPVLGAHVVVRVLVSVIAGCPDSFEIEHAGPKHTLSRKLALPWCSASDTLAHVCASADAIHALK
jgi:hypothetical protein